MSRLPPPPAKSFLHPWPTSPFHNWVLLFLCRIFCRSSIRTTMNISTRFPSLYLNFNSIATYRPIFTTSIPHYPFSIPTHLCLPTNVLCMRRYCLVFARSVRYYAVRSMFQYYCTTHHASWLPRTLAAMYFPQLPQHLHLEVIHLYRCFRHCLRTLSTAHGLVMFVALSTLKRYALRWQRWCGQHLQSSCNAAETTVQQLLLQSRAPSLLRPNLCYAPTMQRLSFLARSPLCLTVSRCHYLCPTISPKMPHYRAQKCFGTRRCQ